jgi:hypothetical protein
LKNYLLVRWFVAAIDIDKGCVSVGVRARLSGRKAGGILVVT